MPRLLHALVAGLAAAAPQPGFALHDGDRVVFYGDSITEQHHYTSYVEDYVLGHMPDAKIDFVNAGWASDNVGGGFGGAIDQRLSRDVLVDHPTVVTVMLGMNDGHRLAWNQPMASAFEAGYKHILDRLAKEAPGAHVTVLGPSPFDDVTKPFEYEGGYNSVLLRFDAFVQAQAETRKLGFCDMNAPLTRMLERAKAIDPELSKKLIPDRIHPGAAAGWVMAASLLQAWQGTPWVSQVGLAYGQTKPVVMQSAQVSDVATTPAGMSWTERDDALPAAFDRSDVLTTLVLKASDVEAALSREPLRVAGLPAGPYALSIDRVEAGRFDAAQLAAGVDLARLDTPMTRQAARLHQLTLAHQGVRFARWRSVQVALADYPSGDRSKASNALVALDAELVKRQHEMARSRAHRFELRRI